jgi:hypothetical protein
MTITVSGVITITLPSGTFTLRLDDTNVDNAIELFALMRETLNIGATMVMSDKKEEKDGRAETVGYDHE